MQICLPLMGVSLSWNNSYTDSTLSRCSAASDDSLKDRSFLQKSIQGRRDAKRQIISLSPLLTKRFISSYACKFMLKTINATKDSFINRMMARDILSTRM